MLILFNQPMIKILFCFSYQGNLNVDWVLDENENFKFCYIKTKNCLLRDICILSFHDWIFDSNNSIH